MSNTGVEDKDAERRRNEISMFAAFALGGEDPPPTADGDNKESKAFDGGSVRLPPKKTEEARQKDEISAFAALAGGDPSSVSSEVSAFAAAAGGQLDSGTFAMSSTKSLPANRASEANLDKAAAALATGLNAGDDSEKVNDRSAGNLSVGIPSRLAQPVSGEPVQRRMEKDLPMYAEEVRMPRPLFFGPIVPPRVLNEARHLVKAALEEQGYDATDPDRKLEPPRLRSLPPEVQNIIGALRSYGFGLSAFPFDDKCSKDEEAEIGKQFWKGTSYVSTFQPVFGKTARMYRQKHGVVLANGQEPPEQQQQEEPPQSTLNVPIDGSFSSTTGLGSPPTARNSSQDLANAAFLANISGESATNPQDNASATLKPSGSDGSMVGKGSDSNDPSKNEINLFSMWARGEGAVDDNDNNSQGNCSDSSFSSFTMEPKKGPNQSGSGTATIATSAESSIRSSTEGQKGLLRPMSDQDLFSQWARGEAPAHSDNNGTFSSTDLENTKSEKAPLRKPPSRYGFGSDAAGTFQRIPTTNLDDSDDDSIVGSEMKKKVGVNEHLDKALASLVDDGLSTPNDGDEAENTRNMLQMMRVTPGGRPLSNLELTNGCVPIYGTDDSPLPVEGDLGIHETKNDEQRTLEQNRSQEIIDKYAGPNIFGPVACPNPSTGPDDNHSWNSRAAPSQRYSVGIGAGLSGGSNNPDRVGVLPVPSDAQSPKPPAGPSRKSTRNHSPRISARNRNQSSISSASTPISRKSSKAAGGQPSGSKRGAKVNNRHRYGWWSTPEDLETAKGGASSDQSVQSVSEHSVASTVGKGDLPDDIEDPLQLPPAYHGSQNVHVDTRLQPAPEKLREENLPLSDLHSATSMAQGLPYLSDRPPSYRYLQIDTQAVGFPPLKGDVEPLFCSLAIYNVETVSGGGHDAHSAPMPDLERCGRVTEVLNFDVVTDPKVENACIGSLWPFFATSTMTPQSTSSASQTPNRNSSLSNNPSLQGTRCGVFPLPSNLNVANLYAVLTCSKVLSEDSDFEIYLKQSKSSRAAGPIDINKYRSKAEKASNQHGSFLMPFAFGVAPLLQVFGADNPVVASSRAVQIPLFRFSAGKGERQIIDHIMVMLYPRADFRANGIGGPAAVTNGGTAMLVMRNFGYLGLHAVVHSRSSLARDRLVDFTGELQIRRRNENDAPVNNDVVVKKDENIFVVPEWHPQFIAEPAINGGRNSVDPFGERTTTSQLENFDDNPSRSQLYAQELAPVPLSPVPFTPASKTTPATSASPRARVPLNRGDIEPYCHMSFCNELLCHPRLLQNCPKGNIVLKVELREMEWKQEHNAFVAHLPRHGPSIHNTRRGPFLIHGTYTSCAVRSSNPHFLDEVKVKLPLELKPGRTNSSAKTLALFFSAYHVKFSSKKKWSKVIPLRSTKRDSRVSRVKDVDEATGERTESSDDGERSGKCKLLLLACGFLPVTAQSSLIENGLHDVKMMYKARPPNIEMRNKGGIASSSLIVTEKSETSGQSLKDSQASSGFDVREDDTTTSGSRTHSEAELLPTDNESDSAFSEGSVKGELVNVDGLAASNPETNQKVKASSDQMILQARIVVHSSLHAQNTVLSDFLQNEIDPPSTAVGTNTEAMQMLGLSREEMIRQLGYGLLNSSSLALPAEDRVLNSIVTIAKPQFCSTYDISKHFVRTFTKLWKTVICGTGETDLSWANPASTMPLRVHAFGALLQMLGNVSLSMSKNGVTQVDGLSKFDMVTLGRMLSLMLDEESMFGRHVKEFVGDVDLFEKPFGRKESVHDNRTNAEGEKPTAAQEKEEKPKRRRRQHQRNRFEFHNDKPRPGDSIDMSDPTSTFGDLLSRPLHTNSNEMSTPQSDLILPDEKSHDPANTTDKSVSLMSAAESDFDFSSLYPPSASRSNITIDSAADFRNNMKLGLQEESSADDFDRPLSQSNVNSIVQKFGGIQGNGKGRFKTAPALATIREDEDDDPHQEPLSPLEPSPPEEGPTDLLLDSELLKNLTKTSVKQMRVPNIKGKVAPKGSTTVMDASMLGSLDDLAMPSPKQKYATMSALPSPSKSIDSLKLPVSDEDIMSAGTAFLDSIGQTFDVGQDQGEDKKEGPGKGAPHRHRKTRSRCSIDWSLMGEEAADAFEIKSTPKSEPKSGIDDQESDDHNDEMTTLELENSNCICLPNFVDRLVTLGKSENKTGRWFPFAYEVVIMMWTSFLQQQIHRTGGGGGGNSGRESTRPADNDTEAALAEAASNAQRASIACAPLLLEMIKQSLGYRVKILNQGLRQSKDEPNRCPLLAVLDDDMQSRLENVISMITDACLNSRNFDSRDLRQMSIDVNDSIVRFLRDMFGFLKPDSAYRLVLAYLSRFVTKDGKHGQDRDSSIGLRCSWEITKLRLNAMTALIRFPDFLRVCSPQMNSWGSSWMSRQGDSSDSFFDGVLDHYNRLQLPQFATDVGINSFEAQIPLMRPHWLAEIVTEVCLHNIWHAEQYIQQRAASLLHELFWAGSQQSMGNGTAPIVASMYITFLEKVLNLSSGLSNFAPKSQLRKDILPCVLFVLQDAPSGLLRAQWRKLCSRSKGKGGLDRYGGVSYRMFPDRDVQPILDYSKGAVPLQNEPDILDMLTLLNMALSTVEYEGCEDFLESEANGPEKEDQVVVWHKEYLLTQGQENQQPFMSQRNNQAQGASRLGGSPNGKREKEEKSYFSSGGRKWHSHDASIVIINSGHQIVSELAALLQSSPEGQANLNQARRSSVRATPASVGSGQFSIGREDTIIFVRAATSLYLHALALRQSDVVIVRALKVSADLVKIFGIKMFLAAVGETLQHWMRVVSIHCGARRAKVRIEATDFLELILRCTWESYGSFFRIRVPLIAVQTEVMERIVTIAAARYYREERRKGTTLDNFSNASAEASLAPLWRTLDRLHHQQASRKAAYKGALIRLAVKLKKLYRAYIAARALSYLSGVRSPKHSNGDNKKTASSDADALVRAYRITVLRVINASAGYSKQFLGFHGTSLSNSSVAHYEAVEDAFLDAADVFSPTELPEHRVAWLQMLADFHASRTKPGEEATCHFQIHATLKQASSLHGSLWSNTPFLPWTNSPADPVHIEGDAQSTGALDYTADFDFEDVPDGPYDANSSRRIFYRVANSYRGNTQEWETGLSKTLFSGVTFAAEYCSVSSWITLREIEQKMVFEAEVAGNLFLRAGIIESCRFVWNLAAQYYSEKFSYAKLASVYGCLARAFVSQVPPIDAAQQQEVSISMGRFYRVWFHGGAPDELTGTEFVYRTASWVRLEQFGDQLREVIKCIIPDRTPIHIDLDGRANEGSQRNYGGFSRLGPAPLEPVKIKVTPLRPLHAKGSKVRGLPEWFHRFIDEATSRAPSRQSTRRHRGGPRSGFTEEMGRMASPGHRGNGNNLSFGSSASVFASGGSSASGSMFSRRSSLSKVADGSRGSNASPASAETELVGVDKFAFLQPVHHKDRMRGNKDWWKPASGDFAQKSLKVTQLQVGQSFPGCVTRQAVVHRVVFTLSPLEAGVDGVCQWCSVLFRTAVATHGMAVLGNNAEPGIGTDAAKVVTDCIHSSRVKEMGVSLLKKNGNAAMEDASSDMFLSADRLGEDEVKKFQNKLARSIIVFLELLHLLIARNRDLLLSVIQEKRKEIPAAVPPPPPPGGISRAQSSIMAAQNFPSNPRSFSRLSSHDGSEAKFAGIARSVSEDPSRTRQPPDDRRSQGDDHSHAAASLASATGNVRTDSAIAVAVQSELQRSFIQLTKTLYPGIAGIMQSETPRWLKQCCLENYFSLGTYRQTRLQISEELSFSTGNDQFHSGSAAGGKASSQPPDYFTDTGRNATESPSASVASSSVFSRNSGKYDL